jgi:hypothetical protein
MHDLAVTRYFFNIRRQIRIPYIFIVFVVFDGLRYYNTICLDLILLPGLLKTAAWLSI